jgi:hypothetical protein
VTASDATGMLVTSNFRMKGCCTPAGSVLRIWLTRCCTSNCAASRSVPQANHTLTTERPCFDVLSMRSTPGAEATARSMGCVTDCSMSAGPAPP